MDSNDKLVQYIDGELTTAEQEAFEQALQQDAALRNALDNLILAREGVKLYGLKNQVANVHHEMMAELRDEQSAVTKKHYPFVRSALKIAAGLFIAMCVFGAYQYAAVSPNGLYSDYYRPYESGVNRGEAVASSAIEKAYLSGDNQAAVKQFEQLAQPTMKERFLAAQAYLTLHQPAKAVAQFNGVLQSGDDTFKDDAEYYLALSYLDNHQPTKARPILEEIYHNIDHLYHDRVTWFTLLKLDLLIKKTGE